VDLHVKQKPSELESKITLITEKKKKKWADLVGSNAVPDWGGIIKHAAPKERSLLGEDEKTPEEDSRKVMEIHKRMIM